MSSNVYEVPTVPTFVESNYEVPKLPPEVPKLPEKGPALKRSNRGAKKCSCNLMCVGVVVLAVVAGASLALAVWSVVEVRRVSSSGLNSAEETANVTVVIESLQNQIDALQDTNIAINSQLNSFVELFPGQLLSSPASSCSSVNPFSPSGYYWVRASNGSAVRVYCDMTRSCGGVTGGWTRVAYLQFENGSDPCPDGFRERNDSGIRTCGINSTTAACPSILFDTYGIPYSRVCGKVLAYQYRSPDAFGNFGRGENLTINSNYVDGVSLTHGGHPRQHIWTFAAARDEVGDTDNGMSVCPCSNPQLSETSLPPEFVGQHYFCDSGVHGPFRNDFYDGDPLWDGAGCGSNSTCCSFNNPPWFQRELPSPTTDDIEMRVCTDEVWRNEGTPIARVEIYVQ